MVCSIYLDVSVFLTPSLVETVNPRRREVPKNYLRTVVGEAKRQVENKRVEEEVAAGSVEDDLAQTLQVSDLNSVFLRLRR